MQLFDCGKEATDAVAGFGNVVGKLGVYLFAALDLGLEVFNGAVDVADGARFGGAGGFESLDLLLELEIMLTGDKY